MRKAREIEPQLTDFARSLLGRNDVVVRFHKEMTATDGTHIWLRPPIRLGDHVEHRRSLCGLRDPETLQQECEACRHLDDIFSGLYHEMAHQAFDSFSTVSDRDRAQMIGRFVKENNPAPGTRWDKIKQRLETFSRAEKLSYPMVCGVISPYMHPLVNSLEDARVNKAMFRAREGTGKMFKAHAIQVFSEGIELPDGSVSRWSDRDLNSQILIGLYCLASEYPYEGWFDPQIERDLQDEQLNEFIDEVKEATSIEQVYRYSFLVLDRLRELGYCRRPDDLEDDPPPEESGPGEADADADEGESGEGGEGSPSSSDDADEGDEPSGDSDDGSGGDGEESDDDSAGGGDDGDDADDPDDGDEGDGGSGDSSSDDDGSGESSGAGSDDFEDRGSPEAAASDVAEFGGHGEIPEETAADTRDRQAMEKAEEQVEHFDAPSATVSGVRVVEHGDTSHRGWATRGDSPRHQPETLMPPETIMNLALFNLRKAFAENRHARKQYGHRSGRLVANRLATVPLGNKEVFSRSRKPGRRDYFVCVTLDISGSTGSGLRRDNQPENCVTRVDLIKRLGMALGELFDRGGVEFAMYAHSGDYDRESSTYTLLVEQYEIKGRRDRWDSKARESLARLGSHQANLDGHTLEFVRKRCDESQATDKIILFVTDGDMPAENYEDELEVLQREIAECKRRGYTLLGVGIENDAPTEHGLETVHVDGVEDIPKLIANLETKMS